MKAGLVVAVNLACLVSVGAAADQPSQSLLFMTAKDWQRSAPNVKAVLAADFMRVFCVRPTMSPVRLAECLDAEVHDGTAYDGAIACVKKLAESGD